jgi:hypothetical protein
MSIHIERGDIHRLDLRTRLPFKYGIATMTETPHVFVRLRVRIDGTDSVGIAADHLPPKWFTKDPNQPIADEITAMLRVIQHAVQIAAGMEGETAFDVWKQLYKAQAHWGLQEKLPPLLTQFGTSLVERAMIEAVCRAWQRPFAECMRANRFGIQLGDIHASLRGHEPAEFLPASPLRKIIARHTVGLVDPLIDADIAENERLDDGLPQSLAACIERYGLRHFKVKVNGDLAHDSERLERIAAVVEEYAPADYAVTLDGNEQFRTLDAFRDFWQSIQVRPSARRLLDHLLFVEQPFHRNVALIPTAVSGMVNWPERLPIIIDESDGAMSSLHEALRLGYAGTSHKNCKGVFKSIVNACLLEQLRREVPSRHLIQSGEDLANIGPVALLQDLTVCAALGIESVERNGHHYFAGLSMFPPAVQQQMLAAHGDLYHLSRDTWPTLRVRDGALAVASLNATPFGVGFVLDVTPFQPVAGAQG